MSRKSGFMQEFKKFILRGNVMDMAVGVIVGGAFTAIVTSLNQDILTPILAIFGGTDFSNLYVKLGSGDTAPVLMYGNFITAVINFLITGFQFFDPFFGFLQFVFPFTFFCLLFLLLLPGKLVI